MITNEGLRRDVGLWGLTANIVNVIVGSGIFVLPALVAGCLGAAGVLAYIFCSILICLIMLCFAEVGSKVHNSGGAYAYIEAAFGKYFGFLAANLLILGVCLMATAAVANAIADTLKFIWPIFGLNVVRISFFIILFSFFTYINIVGVKKGITIVIITTIIKLIPLFLLIFIGISAVQVENLIWEHTPSISDIGKISLLLFFAFQGAESSLSVSGEVKNANKNVPRSIFLSLIIVLIIYLAIQTIAQGILGDEFPFFTEAPLAEVANRLIGPAGLSLMIIAASISMFGYLTSDTLNIPRVMFRSSIDQIIPIKSLGKVHKKYATPYIAIIVYSALCCFFACVGEFKELAILSSASVLLVYLGVVLAVLKLRKTNSYNFTTFKIPGGYTIPIIASGIIIWFLSNLDFEEILGIAIALSILSFTYLGIKIFKNKKKRLNNI